MANETNWQEQERMKSSIKTTSAEWGAIRELVTDKGIIAQQASEIERLRSQFAECDKLRLDALKMEVEALEKLAKCEKRKI